MEEDFLSDEVFTENIRKQNPPQSPAGKWRDLSIVVLYKITRANQLTTRFGQAMILEMQTREGDKKSIWAPERLARELRGSVYPRYVRSLGLTPCKQDTTKQFYKYDLM